MMQTKSTLEGHPCRKVFTNLPLLFAVMIPVFLVLDLEWGKPKHVKERILLLNQALLGILCGAAVLVEPPKHLRT